MFKSDYFLQPFSATALQGSLLTPGNEVTTAYVSINTNISC